MVGNKKVIGVCLTKLYDTSISNYISRLHGFAKKQGYKLIVFNSFLDFYHGDSFDEGARTVYDIINYDIVDAIIIYEESFLDKSIVEKIVEKSHSHNVPVILIDKEMEGCYSVMKECDDAFKYIIRHVIEDHGIKDTFFMAGNGPDDVYSQKRIACYKEVLEKNGLKFDEKNVGYGRYWSEPTKTVMEQLLHERKEMPKAFICANDSMAITVCKVLTNHGYKVPKDIIVTGFDGVPAGNYNTPSLTTCNENLSGLAEQTIRMVRLILEEGRPCCVMDNKYKPAIGESCGCVQMTEDGFRMDAEYLFNALNSMEAHEEDMFNWIDRMLGIQDMSSLYSNLSGCIIENSMVCLNNDLMTSAMNKTEGKDGRNFTDELLVVTSRRSNKNSDQIGMSELKDMIPNVERWAEDDTLCILTSMYAGDEVCGYYVVPTSEIMSCRHKIKRVSKAINVACNVTLNYFRQKNLQRSVETATIVNPVTGLPNLKGTVDWFEDFSSIAHNHKKALSISVYGMPKYTYIYENYGVKDVEEAVKNVAEFLKISNPENCFVGHISEDEFVVINYYNDDSIIGDTINHATTSFFQLNEEYNRNSNKEYFVEVNCGCTVVFSGWEGSVEGFIKFANSEMYMNRLKMGAGPVLKEETASTEHYNALELLIEKNLFHYHFQPIVDAKNGEIYAYEALMRTDASIGMNPLEVLEAAKECNHLYDIEKATLFNVMERYTKEQEVFGGKKVFINTIPGYFLNEADLSHLIGKYGKLMKNVVFELTEQNTVSDDELNNIRRIGEGAETESSQIAIDDYGTGHSNIVNLMRYSPHIIKIDRFLVSNIHEDKNKQMFVRNTIEFARMNDIKVLAEGVETADELAMVIRLGVDFIQGYYTGKPVSVPIDKIMEDIRREILVANKMLA